MGQLVCHFSLLVALEDILICMFWTLIQLVVDAIVVAFDHLMDKTR